MAVQSKALKMDHIYDPAEEILNAVEDDVRDIALTGHDVLVIAYERPEKTKSGLYLPETASARAEDKYQGVVALVVKVGPKAHEKADNFEDGVMPCVGQWVIAPIASCMTLLLGDRTARLIEAQMIRGVVARPDMVA